VGPKKPARHTMSIFTGRIILQFLHMRNFVLLVWNQTIFAVEIPSTISTPHLKFQLNHARHLPIYKLAYIISLFSSFFHFSFRKGVKVTSKWNQVIWLPWNFVQERWCKGTFWYQVWLEYDKHLQSYLRLFTKNNTNMKWCPQGKPHMTRSWKFLQR